MTTMQTQMGSSSRHEADDAGKKKRPVNDGIHHLAKPAHRARFTCNGAIQPVRARGDCIDDERDIAVDIHDE